MDLHNDNSNEALESLITRALDGEMTSDDRLTLDRELIRRPELRGMKEISERIDAIAGPALRGLLDDAEAPRLTLPARPVSPRPARYHRAWWLMPGAAAAVLAGLLWLARSPNNAPPIARDAHVAPTQHSSGSFGDVGSPYSTEGFSTPAAFQQPRIDRQLGRDVLGVLGRDGNIYLIETDHVRTVTQPGGGGRSLPVGGDL